MDGAGVDRGSREEDFPEGETYLIPLAACEGEDKEAAEAGGYRLPLSCEVSSFVASQVHCLPTFNHPMRRTPRNGHLPRVSTRVLNIYASVCPSRLFCEDLMRTRCTPYIVETYP